MENTYIFILVASIALFIVSLVILMHLSESRFASLQTSYDPHEPSRSYGLFHENTLSASPYHPVETFYEETRQYKVAGPRLTFYDQVNRNSSDMKGVSGEYEDSVPDTSKVKALSLMLGPYTRAEFFSAPNYRGKPLMKLENDKDAVMVIDEFKQEYKSLQNGFIKSVRISIIAPYVIVFTQQNHGGISKIIRGNVPVLPAKWNDQIESLTLSPFTVVTLYDQSSYKGAQKVYKNDTSTLMNVRYVGADFTKKTSSIQVSSLMNV